MKNITLIITVILMSQSVFSQFNNEVKAKSLVAKMTIEEKVALVVGNGFKMPGMAPTGPVVGSTQDKVPGAAGTTKPISRLGIPSLVLADGPAGVRIDPIRNGDSSKTYYATAFPVGTLLASTWDTALVKTVGEAFGSEVRAYGVDVILAPALNIHRNPLGGRNFEYYSEDPIVSGNIAAAIVNGIQSNGVGTSIKHFVANNQETNRNTVDEFISERALREIYLKGFEIAVKKSQPWTVMSSYNKVNGVYTSESYDLLTTVLRNEWGFKGFVMTDWFGGKNPVAQMIAGNELLEPGTAEQTKTISDAVKNGKLSEKVLTSNAEKIVNIILQSPSYKNLPVSNTPPLQKNAAISRLAASEGMVLLKNEQNALPLSTKLKVGLFGNSSYNFIAGGTGSGDVNKSYTISLLKGLDVAGFNIDNLLEETYSQYLKEETLKHPKKSIIEEFMHPSEPIAELPLANDIIIQKSSDDDVAIITIGRNAGEGNDRKEVNDFTLTQNEVTLIKNISTAFHEKSKKVIVVLNIGGVIETKSWMNDVDAVLLAWQPGIEAGNAVADVLTGSVNPSGKLATTFPVKYSDVPSAKNFPGKEFPEKAETGFLGMKLIPAEVSYEEGIYVGYRYYNTFNVKPSFEFGYGLSYTTFDYTDLKLKGSIATNNLVASIKITNTGKTAGKEVVQLYITAPSGKLDKPSEELKGFGKTRLLQPGASQILQFPISVDKLASFDTESTSWIVDKGSYKIKIGASSLDIKAEKDISIPGNIIVEKCHKILPLTRPIDELKK